MPTCQSFLIDYFWHMLKKNLLPLALLLFGCVAHAQLYKKPVYPQNYFRWVTGLKPDIVANMGELRNNHWHMGLDVRTNAQVNQNVYAAADGYIAYVGIEPLSWGRWIIINHPNGLSTLYGHLNNFRADLEAYVKEHQYNNESWQTHLNIPAGRFAVKKGDFISLSGTTGGSQGPHVHWEVIDTKSTRRLNPTLFGTPIADNIAPTILRMAMYDRNNSVFDQAPTIFKLAKKAGIYGVPGDTVKTYFNNLSFSIQAYDTRNGTTNQDGIYSARLFVDERELSSFYIDSIGYTDTRYMNCHVDYKMLKSGGTWMQHTSKLPGDNGGVYYDLGTHYKTIHLLDTLAHQVRIAVSDANGNTSNISFYIKNTGNGAPAPRMYEWVPNRLNRIFKFDFEAYLPADAIYDKMNPGYTRTASATANSVSAKHKLGEAYIPVHSNFEVKIKPDKAISAENKNRVVIKRTSNNSTIKKAEWDGEWMTAQFRDFGTFEAFVDNTPPNINSLGSGAVVNLNKASRISFTPTDNFGIASFRAEVDGKWLRFTNDKGRTWLYYFDEKITPGQHTLTVTVTDVAGNKTTRSWQFIRGAAATQTTTVSEKNIDRYDAPVKAATLTNSTTPVKKSSAAKAKPGAAKVTNKKVITSKTNTKKATTTKSTATQKSKTAATKTSKNAPAKSTNNKVVPKKEAVKKTSDKKVTDKKTTTKSSSKKVSDKKKK